MSHFENKDRFRGIRRRGGWNFALERTRYKRRESFVLERNLSILRNMLTHLLKQKLWTQSFNCSLNNLLSTQLLLSFEYKGALRIFVYVYIWPSYDIMRVLPRTKKQSRIFNWHLIVIYDLYKIFEATRQVCKERSEILLFVNVVNFITNELETFDAI